jgi:hypothetical protein
MKPEEISSRLEAMRADAEALVLAGTNGLEGQRSLLYVLALRHALRSIEHALELVSAEPESARPR